MQKNEIHHPHDSLFKKAFQSKEVQDRCYMNKLEATSLHTLFDTPSCSLFALMTYSQPRSTRLPRALAPLFALYIQEGKNQGTLPDGKKRSIYLPTATPNTAIPINSDIVPPLAPLTPATTPITNPTPPFGCCCCKVISCTCC